MVFKSLLILEVAIVEECLHRALNEREQQVALVNGCQLGYLILNFHKISVVRHFFI